MKRRILVFCALCSLFSCINTKVPPELNEALNKSGDNKIELEAVIKYFSSHPQDSLKLRAAIYLIKNLEGLYYYKGEKLDQYLNYLKLINRDMDQGEYVMESFSNLYGPFSTSELEVHYDLEHVKSEDLIKNIDMAFKVWREQPWGKDITFDQFCEYILPFRIADETPEYNRENIYNQFNPVLDSVRRAGGDALMACKAINNKLRKDGWLFTTRPGFLPHFSASKLIAHKAGMCRDMSDAAIYIMRSVGIPVGIDMVQQWPYKALDHTWNTVLNKEGSHVMFIGVDQNPGTEHKPGTKKGKVYRRTYAINPKSLAMQNRGEDIIPSFFRNPRLKDVTDEYASCFDVSVSFPGKQQSNNKYAYLSVFNNDEWVPVHWAQIKDKQGSFSKMEGGITYLPVYFNSDREVVPANYPIALKEDGKVLLLKPDTTHLNKQMTFTHIFPVIPDQFVVANLIGGRFQAANSPDFSDAEDIHKITDPMPFWNTVKANHTKRYRYVRYLSPPGFRCGIGEIEFYTSKRKLSGNLIGTKESYNDSIQSIEKALDNDVSTSFVSKFSTGTWVGLDLRSPQIVTQIRYSAPINEKKDKKVASDSKYELFYWENGHWLSAGRNIAEGDTVTFRNIPSNALYLLRNLSKKTEQRIFTYEDGKQVWW